jgi:hypothetical protein
LFIAPPEFLIAFLQAYTALLSTILYIGIVRLFFASLIILIYNMVFFKSTIMLLHAQFLAFKRGLAARLS